MTIIGTSKEPELSRKTGSYSHTIPQSQETSTCRPPVGKWKINQSPANILARIHMARVVDHHAQEGSQASLGRRKTRRKAARQFRGIFDILLGRRRSRRHLSKREKETGKTSHAMRLQETKEPLWNKCGERPFAQSEPRPCALEQQRCFKGSGGPLLQSHQGHTLR